MKLKALMKEKCLICHNSIDDLDIFEIFYNDHKICEKCFNELEVDFNVFKNKGFKVLSLYKYEGIIKELILRVKAFEDKEICIVFLDRFLNFLNFKYNDYIKVYVPSFFKDDEERGFNHVKEMFKELKIKDCDLFVKNYRYKQSDHSFNERKEIKR